MFANIRYLPQSIWNDDIIIDMVAPTELMMKPTIMASTLLLARHEIMKAMVDMMTMPTLAIRYVFTICIMELFTTTSSLTTSRYGAVKPSNPKNMPVTGMLMIRVMSISKSPMVMTVKYFAANILPRLTGFISKNFMVPWLNSFATQLPASASMI